MVLKATVTAYFIKIFNSICATQISYQSYIFKDHNLICFIIDYL